MLYVICRSRDAESCGGILLAAWRDYFDPASTYAPVKAFHPIRLGDMRDHFAQALLRAMRLRLQPDLAFGEPAVSLPSLRVWPTFTLSCQPTALSQSLP